MNARRPDPWTWRDQLRSGIDLAPETVEVPLAEARGRVLTAEIRSPEDVPPRAVAAMDGFAVRRADLTAPGPCTLPVSADLPARPAAVGELLPGTAARIMTGAPVPRGADAVVEVEATDADPFGAAPVSVTIALESPPPELRHVRSPGEELRRGARLARPGDRVGAGLIGLARTLGLQVLPVSARLRVAIIVTGDELGEDLTTPGAVRESNGTMLAATMAEHGAEAHVLRSGDDPAQLREVLESAAADADLVLTTGGIGHGAYDVVKRVLGEAGTGTSRFEHLALQPGGPQGRGRLPGGVPVIHLPGTPVGALVGFHLFVRQLLPGTDAEPRRLRLGDTAAGARRRTRPGLVAQPGRLGLDGQGTPVVDVLPGHRLAPYGRADAIVLREGSRIGPDGEDTEGDGTALVLPL